MLEVVHGVGMKGTGYGRPTPSYNAELVQVGAGTPMGEYMRRYWHPVAISAKLTDLPQRGRILGEYLVVFRDGTGQAGALFERCAHRQASLFYGRIENDGLRCCYHGWKFDVQGRCVNQPLETGGWKMWRGAAALVPGERTLRPDFHLYGPAGYDTAAAALCLHGTAGGRRILRAWVR